MCSSYLCAIIPLSFLFLCSSYVLYVLLFLFQISFVPPIFVVLFLCSSYLFFIVSSVHYPLFLLSMFYFSPVHVYFFLLPMCYCSSSKFFCSSYFCSIVPLPFLCLSYLLMYICTYVLLFILPINQCSSFLCSVVSAFYQPLFLLSWFYYSLVHVLLSLLSTFLCSSVFILIFFCLCSVLHLLYIFPACFKFYIFVTTCHRFRLGVLLKNSTVYCPVCFACVCSMTTNID